MEYKAIIKEAWQLTRANKRLIWVYAFIPAMISLIASMLYMVYQVDASIHAPAFNEGEHVILDYAQAAWGFITGLGSFGVVVVILIAFFIIAYLMIPVFCQGAMIQLVARIRNGQKISMLDGLTYGTLSFLPLFEYSLLIRSFSLIAILSQGAFILRNLGTEWFKIFIIPLTLLFVIGLILTLFLTYTEYFIAIDKKKVFKSIWSSVKLVIYNWKHTILLMILMLFIIVRIIFNIILVLLIPGAIIGITWLVGSVEIEQIGVILGSIIGIVGLFFAAYFTAVLNLFTTAVWTYTFLELTQAEILTARGDKEENTFDSMLEGGD